MVAGRVYVPASRGPVAHPSAKSISEPWSATVAGVALLFVTFTQGNVSSASQFIILYLPVLYLALGIIGASPRSDRQPPVRQGLLIILALVLLASMSPRALQYVLILLGFSIGVLAFPVSGLLTHLPTYAYYAALLNAGLYLGEIILLGQFGIAFDPTIFNYIGVERDGVIVHWGLNRYGGHHTEPGSFAINFAALTVLSLMGHRKPTLFHWVAVLLLAGTLSITAALMAVVVVISILLANQLSLKTMLLFCLGMLATMLLIVQVLPLLGLLSVDFLTERLVDRGGEDISIYLKAQLIEDFKTRDFWTTVFGNRYADCFHCSYAKSLGFGFYFLFQGGFFGGLVVLVMAVCVIGRLGLKGLALFLVFMLMRLEFYFPQAMMFYLVVAGLPARSAESQPLEVRS